MRYKPLVPALNLDKLAKEPEARHVHARQLASSQTLAGDLKTGITEGTGKDEGKDKPGDRRKRVTRFCQSAGRI